MITIADIITHVDDVPTSPPDSAQKAAPNANAPKCKCLYPLTIAYTESGHAVHCPVHLACYRQNGIPTTTGSAARAPKCTCQYPRNILRNGSGHGEHCPVHIEYCRQNEVPVVPSWDALLRARIKNGQF
jgi:hypothetical protein